MLKLKVHLIYGNVGFVYFYNFNRLQSFRTIRAGVLRGGRGGRVSHGRRLRATVSFRVTMLPPGTDGVRPRRIADSQDEGLGMLKLTDCSMPDNRGHQK